MILAPGPSRSHALTVRYDGRVNRIITDIWVSHPVPPEEISGNSSFEPYATRALWDTGATNSVLAPATVEALGLVPVGKALSQHAGGSSEVNKYLVHMILPSRVIIPGLLVMDCSDTDQFGAIIGMDVLSRGDFTVTHGDGKTCMSFRIPSVADIDYVEESRRHQFRGTARNAPCPCGKVNAQGVAVKFKHCHGQ